MLVSAISMNQKSEVNFSSRRGKLAEQARKLGVTVFESDNKKDLMKAIAEAKQAKEAEILRQIELKRQAKEPARQARLERRAERRAARAEETAKQAKETQQAEAARPKDWVEKLFDNKYVSAILGAAGNAGDAHKAGHGY